MDDVKISLSQLQEKVRILDQYIDRYRKEKEHLEFTISYIEKEEMRKVHFKEFFDRKKDEDRQGQGVADMSKLAKVIEILQQHGKAMKTSDIHNRLISLGIQVPKTTHDANMSRWAKDPVVPIEKAEYGHYQYRAHS